jgi:hypothetical protein
MQNIKPWTQEEELELIKSIKNKMPIEEIAKKHNRNIISIDLRLQKIIYENISKNGKDAKSISLALNIPYEDVLKKYELYKDNKNSKYIPNIENVEDINNKIEKLERENKLIKLILENKILHKKLNEQIIKNNINKNILDVIKDMRN